MNPIYFYPGFILASFPLGNLLALTDLNFDDPSKEVSWSPGPGIEEAFLMSHESNFLYDLAIKTPP